LEVLLTKVNEQMTELETALSETRAIYRDLEAQKVAGKWIDDWHRYNNAPSEIRELEQELEGWAKVRSELLERLKAAQ
jgi:hypothetical protein